MKRIITPGQRVTLLFWNRVGSKNVELRITTALGNTSVIPNALTKGIASVSGAVPGEYTVAENLPATLSLVIDGQIVRQDTLQVKESSSGTPGAPGQPGPKGDKGDDGDDGTDGKPQILRPAGIAFIGDSWVAGVGSNGGRFTRMTTALLGQRYTMIAENGVSGSRLDEMAARWDTEIAPVLSQAQVVVIEGGPNDASQNTPLATSAAAITQMVNKARAAGVIPVVVTSPPLVTAAPHTASSALAQWQRSNAKNLGYLVADTWGLADPTTGLLATAYRFDNLHVNDAGHMLVAQSIASVLNNISAPQRGRLANSDVEPGAVSSRVMTSLTSNFPSGWSRGYNTQTSGLAYSLATVEGWKGSAWRRVLASINGVSTERIRLETNFAGNDTYEVWMRLRLSGMSGVAAGKGVNIQTVFTNAAAGGGTVLATHYHATIGQNGDYVLRFRGTVPAGTVTIEPRIYLDLNGASGTIDVGEWALYTGTSLSAVGASI